ncbi:MAG TPA: NADH-quinone oxidoreductase subunit C [Anaeromyxobacter sp.]|nr:NADH-quinone oxidoreductase subunit C [Anaeromyxobacter sp.]
MTDIATIPAEMGADGAWEERRGSRWLEPEVLDVRRMAQVMREKKARFVTMTALLVEGEKEPRLSYHWDLDGSLLTVVTRTEEKHIPSIYGICEAADWIEREIHEQYAVVFDDHPYEPLLLRAGDAPGVNLPEEDE